MPLNFTAVAPVKAVPVITTDEPMIPLVGKKLPMFALTVKLLPLVPVPEGVVTAIVPVVAPLGTVAVIWKFETTENEAVVPLNVTVVAPVNASPFIVMLVPTIPLVGEKLAMLGSTVKEVGLVAVPAAVVTVTDPVVAPLGTVAVI